MMNTIKADIFSATNRLFVPAASFVPFRFSSMSMMGHTDPTTTNVAWPAGMFRK
jgi:hypothetical protein